MVEILNESNFEDKVLKSSGKVLVEFFATWCPHCRRMEPVVEEISAMLNGQAVVYQVDIDESPDLANEYAPNGFPTFVVFNDGRLSNEETGEQTLDNLLNLVAAS